MDIMRPETRSALMGRIRSANTKPEIEVRRIVHRLGYRFRLGGCRLPGRPDLVLPRLRTAILVHGCFWHRHEGCRFMTTPKTRADFWQAKFSANLTRDARVQRELIDAGWKVITVWECELEKPTRLLRRLKSILERRARSCNA